MWKSQETKMFRCEVFYRQALYEMLLKAMFGFIYNSKILVGCSMRAWIFACNTYQLKSGNCVRESNTSKLLGKFLQVKYTLLAAYSTTIWQIFSEHCITFIITDEELCRHMCGLFYTKHDVICGIYPLNQQQRHQQQQLTGIFSTILTAWNE